MSSDKNELTDEMADAILENLKYETIGDDYELVDVREVSDKNSDVIVKRKYEFTSVASSRKLLCYFCFY